MPIKIRRSKALVSSQRLNLEVSNKATVAGQASEIFPLWAQSTRHALSLDRWVYDELLDTDMPKVATGAPQDIKDLRDSSTTSWAQMISDSMSQDLIADGIRAKDSTEAPPGALELWQRNGLDARQRPCHDGAIRHGKAFNLVGKAVGRIDGQPTAFIRSKSATCFDAFYRDDFDEWPEYAMEGYLQTDDDGSRRWRLDLYDDVYHHWLTCEEDGSKMAYISSEPHEMGVCPVVRAAPNIDLRGRTVGEVERYINIFRRINQGTMDRLVVQRFGAFIVRYAAGIEQPKTPEEAKAVQLMLSATRMMISESGETKFGSLPATPLDGYIRSREADIRDLSAVSQTPSFHMLGLSDNVGADGLAAAEASHMRKMDLWRLSLGEFWESSIRLAGHAAGLPDVAADFESRMHWRDTTKVSFQSFVQGLGVMATQLGIPQKAVWGWVPGWDQSDTANAERLAAEQERVDRVKAATAALLGTGAAGGNTTQPR